MKIKAGNASKVKLPKIDTSKGRQSKINPKPAGKPQGSKPPGKLYQTEG